MEYEDTFAEEDNDDIEVIQEGEEGPDPGAEGTKEQENDDEDQPKTVVKPKKRVLRPQIKLDATRLVGPRGIGILESTFKDIKFKGKGHELEDLNKTMQTLEHWAHRLFPKMTFDDVIDKIEDLGFKKNVMVHVTKIRLGMEDEIQTPEVVGEEEEEEVRVEPDPFDQLLSSVPKPPQTPSLTEEQRARMLRNRLIAEEIRMKKMKAREEALKIQKTVMSSDSIAALSSSSSDQSAS